MRITHGAVLFAATFIGPLLTADLSAQITRIDFQVVESPAFDGQSFGDIGQYERLRGVAYGEVDPNDVRHREIVNIRQAPLNARGRVEYSTTVEIYRPIDLERWNRAIYHIVPNRGGASAGDAVFREMGFAVVQVGWQGDLTATDRNIVPFLPIATYPDGSSIIGPTVEEFIFNNEETVSEASLTYATTALIPALATFTVRARQGAPRVPLEDGTWSFTDDRRIRINRPSGFDGGAIYDLLYLAKDPIVMGLGFAATRDVISFLRYEITDGEGNPNPLMSVGLANTAISLGVSQSGRFLRDMLYLGFNEDVGGRIVFDGMHPNIAGSRKTFTNYQFGQPGRWQKQHEDHFFPGDQFPFTYGTVYDAISDRADGLLVRCSATNTCPRIIHSDGEAEIWQARSSLIVTDALGEHVDLPDNVRAYLIAGTRHGGGRGVHVESPRLGMCQNLNSPVPMAQIRRALTVALYEWVVDGTEPPPSRFPSVTLGTLVPPASIGFPSIPDVTFTGSHNPLRRNNHNTFPPLQGGGYTVLAGRVDPDGNMLAGIRHPDLSVPIGTFTGWNLRREGFAEGAQCGGAGSFIPFASDEAERRASGDPRLSIEERYPTHDAYVSAVAQAAERLVQDRLLLRRDAQAIVELAEGSMVARSN
ncbi:MAG: hypothetical protein IIB37_11075 [Gemmatimonadetes bacterium]|nr:hypothetical protein [Gemmatimonadota bacterium]